MKFCVIGLGRFGFQVATSLAENGAEVIAVDSNESIVASIRDYVTQAICMRVIDISSLQSLGAESIDTIIVAMGENFAQSILITALLKKKLNVPYVITRAVNEIHKEILRLIGADEVILPEQEIGIRLADSLSSPFTDQIRITQDFSISQLTAPRKIIGKLLRDIKLYDQYNVICLGIKIDEKTVSTDPDHVISEYDKLIFAGHNDQLKKISRW